MSLKGIIRLAKCKNISEYSETELIMNFSLYQNALIDLNEMEAEATTNAFQSFTDYEFKTPKDIKTLKKIINSTDNIFLPCYQCERSMSFRSVQAINPMIVPKSMKEGYSKEVENALSYNKEVLKTYRESGYITDEEKLAEKKQTCIDAIKNYFVNRFSEIRKEYICSYNHDHIVFVDFRLYDPLEGVDYGQDREEIEQAKIKNPELFAAYEKLKGCLMIQKVGQYPSLMDMQSFNIEKYRKVLSKKSISDFTRAVGLYASGIGSGSFLYLRRIMERLFEEAHQSVINDESWDEKAYIDMRFGERVKYLETFGKVIFPSELERVKPHLYGVISKGVHESTDEECIELFPYLKFAIETLLDEQIQQKEHEKKIKELERVINKSVK